MNSRIVAACGHAKKYARRFLVMVLGLVVLALGVALFTLSAMGTDPMTAMTLAVAGVTGISYPVMLIMLNTLWFAIELLFGRPLIGIGTFANWVGIGYMASGWLWLLRMFVPPQLGMASRIALMLAGVLVLSLGASLYQTPGLGIAPYDSASVILSQRTPLPYFWCRIITDVFCTVVALALGGLAGAGTAACALCLGPLISFYNRHVSQPLCGPMP